MQYEKRILNQLLDSYENSLLSRGENKVTVHIAFPFTKKTIPEYFDESSLAYEEIHAVLKGLEQKGYISIVWKKGKENHIAQKVLLCSERVQDVYGYVKRIPQAQLCMQQLQLLERLGGECGTPIVSAFINWLSERLTQGQTVKEFIDVSDLKETERLIRAIAAVEENREECYIREFSVRCFGDTKALEKRISLIGKIMRRFSDDYKDMDTYAILAEYRIYHTPNYVYFKGAGILTMGKNGSSVVDLSSLKQGIGVSGEDLDTLQWTDLSEVKKVITIENLTTFFRWDETESIIIYLGGYHNSVRRKLLQNLYQMIPQARYLHFGDIDVGGFEIYLDLCAKTGIPLHPHLMGTEQLEKYSDCTNQLTEHDQKRLEKLLGKVQDEGIADVLHYMKESGKKLEQECIMLIR